MAMALKRRPPVTHPCALALPPQLAKLVQMSSPRELESFRFAVAFSFAGPHREKVRAIAEIVSEAIDPGIKDRSKGHVFFDEWFEHEILGSDMDVLLQDIYHKQSR